MSRPQRRANEPVRVAVVGGGAMGSNHARVYRSLKGVELVAVVDADVARARELADLHGVQAATLDELPDLVDAATVAVPSTLHAEVGAALLERGVHCLVEKPLATDEHSALALIEAARRGGARLLVGHIERFNPAVIELKRILAEGHDLLAVDARRMSAVSARIADVDVVSDLMVHDLDIVLDLVESPVVDVTARGVHRAGSHGDAYVTALLTCASGALVSLTASRVTQNQVRQLQVTTDQRFFTVDYSNQELNIYRQGRIGGIDDADGMSRFVLDVGTERVFVRRTEPLVQELKHFIEVVKGGVAPLVTGEHALEALRLVWQIQDQVGKGRPA